MFSNTTDVKLRSDVSNFTRETKFPKHLDSKGGLENLEIL